MRLVNRQYGIGTALQQRANALSLVAWKFQKEAVSSNTDPDKTLVVFFFFFFFFSISSSGQKAEVG